MIRLAKRSSRIVLQVAAGVALLVGRSALAQDTTFRGVMISGAYDPLRDKIGITVLPVTGAYGDSIRTIISRDLDFSDRFTVIAVDSADPNALRPTPGGALNYALFARLNATAVVQITTGGAGLHVVLHDVGHAKIANIGDFALPAAGLGRDWRMGVHRVSDEIERWMTGQKGISATRIAFMRGQSIRIIDSDGASEITVPTETDGASPAWSPDGKTLAYTTFGTNSRLLILDLATGRSRSLAGPTRNTTYITPVFGGNGATVFYSREGENGSDIFSIPVSGGSPQQLTAGRGTLNTMPTISPDGRRIAFVSGRLGPPELYIMDSDGSGLKVFTDYDFSEKNYRSDPDWSPDGRLVAYQERINDHFQIRTIRVNGGTPKQLTNDGENEQPSWAPDGRHLVFTSTRTGVRQLWVLDTESNRLRQLTKAAGSKLASWSARLAGE
jgi:TolB protein